MNPHPDRLILAARRILILTHVEPDADAIGGMLGLGHALQALGKDIVMACQGPVPDRYARLPGVAGIAAQADGSFDLVISLDCSDSERLGAIYRPERWGRNRVSPPLLNIDHHISNTRFGSTNWVEPAAVATAEMVLELLDCLGVPIEAEIATCLLYGIVGDTMGLHTPNVTPQVLAKVIRLMQLGAPLHQAISDLFQRKPLSLLAVWGQALSALHVEGRLAWTLLSAQTRQACGYPSTDGLQLSSLLLEADGVDLSAVLAEDDAGRIDVSLRARNGVDVSGLAVELGGGGHASAAGARITGPLEEAAERVIGRLRQHLADAPRAPLT